MKSPLTHLIDRLHTEGQAASSGRFTLDFEKSLRLKPVDREPGDFFLKLVQTAHLAGADRLTLTLQGSQMEAHFPAPRLEPQSLGTPRQGAAAMFFAAARAAGQFHRGSVLWGCWGPELGLGFALRQGESETRALSGHGQSGVEAFLSVQLEHSLNWDALRARVGFSQVPITFQGKQWAPELPKQERWGWLLDRLYFDPGRDRLSLPHATQFAAKLYDLGHLEATLKKEIQATTYLHQWRGFPGLELAPQVLGRVDKLTQLPSRAIPIALVQGLLARHCYYVEMGEGATTFVHPVSKGLERPSLSPRAWLRVPCRPQRVDSALRLVQHGVLLPTLDLRLLLNDCEIVLADSQQRTDLSGLRLVQDEHLGDTIEWIQHHILTLRPEIRRALNDWKAQGAPKKWVIRVLEEQNLDIKDSL